MQVKTDPESILRKIIAERTKPLVAWVGAGISKQAGLPLWSELKEALLANLIDNNVKLQVYQKDKSNALVSYLKHEKDFWLVFDKIKKESPSTYRSTIRAALSNVDRCDLPEIYKLIWKLPLSGLFNLNIDRLATRAFNYVFQGEFSPDEFSGNSISSRLHLLQGYKPFIANMHGILNDESSWVFTKSELDELTANKGYQVFIDSCLATRVNIYLGITADDIAVGGHLEKLTKSGLDMGDHFWITHRNDSETENWAQNAGIHKIIYESINGDHSRLYTLIESFLVYSSKDEEAKPVYLSTATPLQGTLPSPKELSNLEPVEIRRILNGWSKEFLEKAGQDKEKEYDRFLTEYSRAIYSAWYVSDIPNENELFGYTLVSEIAEGGYGRVFKALNKEGKVVAIKVLKDEVRRKKDMLNAFRRGVRSARILSNNKVKGMVNFIEASEIPACLVMDFIDGPNLYEAINSNFFTDWCDILKIAMELTKIIRSAHALPERVLHRDIRPQNIMLKDYCSSKKIDITVLDFDLSWHTGATEVSVLNSATASGYVAPEQVEHLSTASSRSAYVDSYGIGMTLLFMRSKTEPKIFQSQHENWITLLDDLIISYPSSKWSSTPNRFARIINNATLPRQVSRWDLSKIEGSLTLLLEAEYSPASVCSISMLAEELTNISAKNAGVKYLWSEDKNKGTFSLMNGVIVEITGEESVQLIKVRIEWSKTGAQDSRNIKKYLSSKTDQAISILKKYGYHNVDPRFTSSGYILNVEVDLTIITKDIHEASIALVEAIQKFHF